MRLTKENLKLIDLPGGSKPADDIFSLPEKVIQFGTGVLLRGLPDYFIDKANKNGLFNGRVVVIKTTSNGASDAFEKQDGLYTHCIRGVEKGIKQEENIINASISRVLSASSEWSKILECAANPEIQVIISNTTEVGIMLQPEDDIRGEPPISFPGKLLAFLYARYKKFNGDKDRGFVIIPTELLPDNGDRLESIVIELAHLNKMDYSFMEWLENCNYFCNSLVDRIVPGKLNAEQNNELNYNDELGIISESYRLWAIEAKNEKVKTVLSFSAADEAVVLSDSISIHRELKLRLLNGSHTFSCGLAHLAGFGNVQEAMNDKEFSGFLTTLMMNEIAPAITNEKLTGAHAKEFAAQVLDRFRNPYIEHRWLSICLQYSSKMITRNIPIIVNYLKRFGSVPEHMALGFAAHILFMRGQSGVNGNFTGHSNGEDYLINDDNAGFYSKNWSASDINCVKPILSDKYFWGVDLGEYPAFIDSVQEKLNSLVQKGVKETLSELMGEKQTA